MISDLREGAMSKSKQGEAQITAALKQVEAGRTAEDAARECGVSKHTIYAWKSESFHGKLREECLRPSWFRNLFDARVKIADWKKSTTRYGSIAVSTIELRTSSHEQ
jgi:hypothetical protein